MPDRIDKSLLLMGLFSFLGGQIWINVTGAVSKDEIIIDMAHWLMLVGAALMIPFASKLPRKGIGWIAGPLLIVGIILIIGMCMIDFVLWSFTDNDLRNQVIGTLIETPSVWQPFIAWAGWVFTPALGLCGWMYWRASKPGVLLIQIGAIVIGLFGLGSNPYGYSAILVGFILCFYKDRAEAVSN